MSLEITTTQSVKLIQDLYRNTHNDPKYTVVMFRHKQYPRLDRTVIVKSVGDLVTIVMKKYHIEEYGKRDILNGEIEKVKSGYFQWYGQENIELVVGHYIPDIFFATLTDTNQFMKLINGKMESILQHCQRELNMVKPNYYI